MNRKKIIAVVTAVSLCMTSAVIFPIQSYAEENETYQEITTGDEIEEAAEDVTEGAIEEAAEVVAEDAIEVVAEDVIEEVAEAPEVQTMTTTAISPNAWKKVNGQYVNCYGVVIPGAKKKGIDVSEHQGIIDWEKVKADGIEYAILRCGYGKDHVNQDDKQWYNNVAACERLGIPYGVYLYSYATDVISAEREADHALRLLQGHNPSYPVYLDMEDPSTSGVGSAMLGTIAKIFCDKVSAAGYKVGIYCNLYWRTHHLTSSVFDNSNWSFWIAQYNATCDYQGTYDMWQCTSTGSVNGISGNVDLNFWMKSNSDADPVEVDDLNIIKVSSHMQTYGWMSEVSNGYQSGVTGEFKRMEAIKIRVGDGYGNLGVTYSTFADGTGWQQAVSNGAVSGTEGQFTPIQAIKIELTGTQAVNYDIYYRVHSQTYGWLGWAKNGAPAGSQGYGKRMEAVQIAVLPKGSKAPGSESNAFVLKPTKVTYSAYVAGKGWTTAAENGMVCGTTGISKALEALQVNVSSGTYSGGVKYDTYMQAYRWTGEKENDQIAGLAGNGKRMEAVKISLTGEIAQHYDIYYRVHSQTFGWLGWAKNGDPAGTIDYAKRVEAIQIQLVEKDGAAPESTGAAFHQSLLSYQSHVQTYGWQGKVYEGELGGTIGLSKRMEAIKLSLSDTAYQDELQYQVHMQTYGWQNGWTKGGNVAGTTGQGKRLEAIRIKLTGMMAQKYDIYYSVHIQTHGWMDWAKNGEAAGSEGLGKRLEAIRVVLVPKGGAAPGRTNTPFVKK